METWQPPSRFQRMPLKVWGPGQRLVPGMEPPQTAPAEQSLVQPREQDPHQDPRAVESLAAREASGTRLQPGRAATWAAPSKAVGEAQPPARVSGGSRCCWKSPFPEFRVTSALWGGGLLGASTPLFLPVLVFQWERLNWFHCCMSEVENLFCFHRLIDKTLTFELLLEQVKTLGAWGL